MINHYLLTLTAKEEDRALTTIMRSGCYWESVHNGPCLVGTVRAFPSPEVKGRRPERQRFLTTWQCDDSVEDRYDLLCERFGAPRVNALIRDRILSNRVWRILQNAPVSQDTEVVESVQ